jgi:hypothetical protein
MTTVKVRQNSMRDIACSGSVFAYSTLASNGGQFQKVCQSTPMRPAKKKSSGYASNDKLSLTL